MSKLTDDDVNELMQVALDINDRFELGGFDKPEFNGYQCDVENFREVVTRLWHKMIGKSQQRNLTWRELAKLDLNLKVMFTQDWDVDLDAVPFGTIGTIIQNDLNEIWKLMVLDLGPCMDPIHLSPPDERSWRDYEPPSLCHTPFDWDELSPVTLYTE